MRRRYRRKDALIAFTDSVMVLQPNSSCPRRSLLAALAHAIGDFYVAVRLTWGVVAYYRRFEKSLVAAKPRPYQERLLLPMKISRRSR